MDGGREEMIVRTLRREDTPRLVRMDREISGRNRPTWYERKVERALMESDVMISLGAETDGLLVGALLGSVQFGEFGQPEPIAILDTMLVDRGFSRKGVGRALLDQLVKNLQALGIVRVRTEVAWNEWELLGFFERSGFEPVPRLVLELDLAKVDPSAEEGARE